MSYARYAAVLKWATLRLFAYIAVVFAAHHGRADLAAPDARGRMAGDHHHGPGNSRILRDLKLRPAVGLDLHARNSGWRNASVVSAGLKAQKSGSDVGTQSAVLQLGGGVTTSPTTRRTRPKEPTCVFFRS